MKYTRRRFVATLLVLSLTALLVWLNTGAEAQSPPPVDLSDDFNDNSLDSNKWNINSPGSPAVVSEQGQVIQIALPPNTATYNGIGSKTTHDMRDKTVEVEVVQPISQAGWAENFIQVVLDAQNYYLISAGAGSMVFRSMVAGVNDQLILNYDPVACRFWGIRHDQATNKVSLQTSPDGLTWTTRKRVTAGFSLSAVSFYLYAGAYGTGNSNPGVAKYDNFQVVPSSSRAVNVAHSLNGAFASASSTYSLSYQASSTINGDRKGVNWNNNGGWNDVGPPNTFPDWLQVDFEGSKTINEIDVFTLQDNLASPTEPTETMTFSLYGLTGYEVQYWNGTAWQNIPGGSVTGNNLVWRKFTFTPLTTSKIRILTNASVDGYSRIVEVEAYTPVVHPLAAKWKFEEGSGTTATDSSGNGSNGTVQGATWITGQAGAALDFNGANSLVNVASAPALVNLSNNFTLSFWANPRATHQIDPETTSGFGGTSGQKYVVGPKWYSNGDAGAGISVGTNGISVYEHAANYMPATLVYQATLTGWTHIVLVYKNKQPKLYVNGVLVRTGLTSPMNSVHIEPVYIGGMGYGYFDGMLDEMTIYKDSFTPSDVQAMYSSQTNYKGGMMSMETAASAPSSNITLFKQIKGTDISSFGVGGIRDRGFGRITVSGMPATIKQAYLYWHGSNFNPELNLGGALTIGYVANNQLTFVAVPGTFIGKSADNFWPFPAFPFPIYPNTVAWRADITSLVNHGGPNKNYDLQAFNSFPSFNPNGASIIILYNDAFSSNDSDVYIYDGNDGNSHNSFDSDGWFVELSNFEYGSGTAALVLHVADGQLFLPNGQAFIDPDVKLNGGPWLTGNVFTGENANSLWEIKNFNITQFVQQGTNNLTIQGGPAPPPPFTLDGLNLVVATVIVPAVREVKSVTWETINSTIDDNPNTGGGKRIFPDWQIPGDQVNRRVVRAKAQTTMGQGQKVFFRAFDVDEPGTDALPIDTNGSAFGGDNRGDPKEGVLNLSEAFTDSNGVATVEFTTTMQPGDNFMVAAGTDLSYLNGIIANGTGLRDGSGNDLPTVKGKATPMLTVWRRLHVEVDSMGRIVGNQITGTILSVSQLVNIVVPPPKVPSPPKFTLTLDKNVEGQRHDNGQGTLFSNGVAYPVTTAVGNQVLLVGSAPSTGSTFTLVDDDDYNFSDQSGPLDGDEGEDIANELPNDPAIIAKAFSLMQHSDNPEQNIYAQAYIKPVYDGGGAPGNTNDRSNEIFFENVPVGPATEAQMAIGSKNNEDDAFWVVYVQFCYQGPLDLDLDVNSEPSLLGITNSPLTDVSDSTTSSGGVLRGGEGSLIYLEVIKDAFLNNPALNFDLDKRVVPHEVGHQFGLKGDTFSIFQGIMSTGFAPNFFNLDHLNILRWRVHSPGRPLPPPVP
jgi:hypothetical protein